MRKFNDSPEEAKIRELIVERGLGGKLSPKMVLQIPRELLYPHIMDGKRDYEIGKVFGVSNGVINILRKYYDLPKVDEVKKMLECVEDEPVTPEQAGAGMATVKESLEQVEEALSGVAVQDVQTYTATHPEIEEQDNALTYDTAPIVIDLRAKPEPAPEIPKVTAVDIILPRLEKIHKEIGEKAVLIIDELQNNAKQDKDTVITNSFTETGAVAAPYLLGVAKMLDRLGKEKVSVTVVVRRV